MGDCGAPGEIRTPDTQVRSLVLYPAELQAQTQEEAPLPGEGGIHIHGVEAIKANSCCCCLTDIFYYLFSYILNIYHTAKVEQIALRYNSGKAICFAIIFRSLLDGLEN